jgi:putative transposase
MRVDKERCPATKKGVRLLFGQNCQKVAGHLLPFLVAGHLLPFLVAGHLSCSHLRMPRKNLIRSKEFPYHVTVRANNREAFPLPIEDFWKVCTEELYLLELMYQSKVHAFVLMPNHIHLLITAPESDLGVLMRVFLSAITRRANFSVGRTGRIFGSRYFWTIITSTRYYGNVLKYVYRNPVKANLCTCVSEYEFSTASGIFGRHSLPLPIHHTQIGLEVNLPDSHYPELWKEWLNQPFAEELEIRIQKSLRRKVIKDEKKVSGYFFDENTQK